MPRDELESQLRAWGDAQLGRHAHLDRKQEGPGSHPISRAREFAPGTRARAALRLATRDGSDRRRQMAKGAGIKGFHMVPKYAVDPIRCTETRHAGPLGAVDGGIPLDLRPLDQALRDLYRQDPLCGLVMRMEYTGRGFQADKADEVSAAIGKSVSLRQYREQLKIGRSWLLGRLNRTGGDS